MSLVMKLPSMFCITVKGRYGMY